MKRDNADYLIGILNKWESMFSFLESEDHQLSYVIFLSLNKDERERVVKEAASKEMKYYAERMMKRAETAEKGSVIVKNEPISTLLKWYCDRASGKVTEARKKLRSRFEAQSDSDKIKIVDAFLKGSKSDRLWCYDLFNSYWKKRWEKDIVRLWREHSEKECAPIIIKHLPEEFIKENSEALLKYDNIDYCIRMKTPELYSGDLNTLDGMKLYLYIIRKIGKKLTDEEAERALFHTFALEQELWINDSDGIEAFAILDANGNRFMGNFVKYAVWVLGNIGNGDTIVNYREWVLEVKDKIEKIPLYQEVEGEWAENDEKKKQYERDINSAILTSIPIDDSVAYGLMLDIEAENERRRRSEARWQSSEHLFDAWNGNLGKGDA